MSRAYRIKVRQSEQRVVKAQDHVSTQLELLTILPPEQMADLLARALEERGFERCGDQLSREQDGVVLVVDASTGTVSWLPQARTSAHGRRRGRTGGLRHRPGRRLVPRNPARCCRKGSSRQKTRTGKPAATRPPPCRQTEVTDRLAAQLSEVRQELDQVVNRVTAEALKRKAAQLGQIKELTEDPLTGSLTIVLEV